MDPADSGDLLRRSRSGDDAALQVLLARHVPALRAFVRVRMSPLLRAHESGSDLVQSTCVELLQKIDDLEFRGEAPFRAWLYNAVLNTLRDREKALRAQKRDVRRNVPLSPGSGAGDLADCYSRALSPSGQALAEERVRALESAFDELPEQYREVISLSRLARLSRAQVAAEMGRSEDSVRNLLSRGLAALANALRGQGGTERA